MATLTDAQYQANRTAAAVNVRRALGLPDNPSDWTQDQRNSYNLALANYYQANPAMFSDQDAADAAYQKAHPGQSLEDDSFSISDFAAEAVKPVSDAAQSVGQGVLTVANAAKWAIPLLAVVAGVILLLALNRRANAK